MVSQEVWLFISLALTSITVIRGQTLCTEGQLRLTQTVSVNLRNAGRVEICIGGLWGTIAADSVTIPWSEKNAQVACIELGFSGALNSILQRTIPFFEQSTLPIHLTSVMCNGTERNITLCSHSTFVPSTVSHGTDVYIVCRPGRRDSSYSDIHTGGPQSGDIRLFGDVTNGRGAVSIYSTTLGWQGICPDSSWTNSDANTICQDLGYQGGAIAAPLRTSVGPGGLSLPRSLYGANCPGISSDFVSAGVCSFSIQMFSSDPGCIALGGTFAAVSCTSASDGSVRLIGGDHSREGVVEIAYNGRWGMVCNGDFSTTDARSICQGLGYGRDDARTMSFTTIDLRAIESNLKPIWLNDLSCLSSDRSLPACVNEDDVIGFVQCRFDNIAGVDCGQVADVSVSRTIGIVVGVLFALFGIAIFLSIFGKDWWRKRHTYSWYSTLTTPSSWCDCDCFSGSSSSRTNVTFVSASSTSNSANSQATPTTTFNLTRNDEPQAREAEPEPTGPEPDDPGLTKAPPPSYQTASNFPTHDLQPDLPPPYPGPAYPPPSAPPSAPPAPNNESYPPAWNEAAYPPPVPLPDSSSELPYPVDNAPYPS